MDNSTNLLVKGAAIVVIIAGVTTIFSDELRQIKYTLNKGMETKYVSLEDELKRSSTWKKDLCKDALDDFVPSFAGNDSNFYRTCLPIINEINDSCNHQANKAIDYWKGKEIWDKVKDTCRLKKLEGILPE